MPLISVPCIQCVSPRNMIAPTRYIIRISRTTELFRFFLLLSNTLLNIAHKISVKSSQVVYIASFSFACICTQRFCFVSFCSINASIVVSPIAVSGRPNSFLVEFSSIVVFGFAYCGLFFHSSSSSYSMDSWSIWCDTRPTNFSPLADFFVSSTSLLIKDGYSSLLRRIFSNKVHLQLFIAIQNVTGTLRINNGFFFAKTHTHFWLDF